MPLLPGDPTLSQNQAPAQLAYQNRPKRMAQFNGGAYDPNAAPPGLYNPWAPGFDYKSDWNDNFAYQQAATGKSANDLKKEFNKSYAIQNYERANANNTGENKGKYIGNYQYDDPAYLDDYGVRYDDKTPEAEAFRDSTAKLVAEQSAIGRSPATIKRWKDENLGPANGNMTGYEMDAAYRTKFGAPSFLSYADWKHGSAAPPPAQSTTQLGSASVDPATPIPATQPGNIFGDSTSLPQSPTSGANASGGGFYRQSALRNRMASARAMPSMPASGSFTGGLAPSTTSSAMPKAGFGI